MPTCSIRLAAVGRKRRCRDGRWSKCLPVAALADAASNDDTVLVGRLLDEHAGELPRLQLVLGDRGSRNLAHRAARDHRVMFEVRYWEDRPEGGFKPIRPIWRVEDTFAQLHHALLQLFDVRL